MMPCLRVLFILLLCGAAANAQPVPQRPFREGVTLAVDAEAARTLLTLEDRWAAGQWEAALDSLIELSDIRGRALVQTDPGEGRGLARYARVQIACDRLLAALPPEGLAAYRRRIEPRARRLWEAWTDTGDVAALDRLSDQMFYSRYGDRAAWELGQQAWNRGELSAARSHWRSLLPAENAEEASRERRYPDSSISPADVAARLILCDLMDGDPAAARTGLVRLIERDPMATGTLAGREGTWAELLTAELGAAESWEKYAAGNDVPTFAGAASRAFRSPKPIDLGSELWTAALPVTRLPAVPRMSLFPTSPPAVYHPAVVDDVVYLNDGQRIFAWRLDTGRPAWGGPQNTTGQIFPAVDVEPPLEPRRPVSGAPRWTVTVHGGRLYARMGSAVTTPSPLELRDQRTELVCLDISEGEGRLLWSKSGDQLAWAGLDENVALWSWEGTPLAENGRLYAVLSRRRPQLEWNVVCLDAETGLVLWQRPVGITRPTPPDNENLATQLLLTLADGRLFLSTDGGAIAALDAAAGRLLWAVTYESEPIRLGAGQPAPRWIGPPCLVADGQVFAAPLDADRVVCLDAVTGIPRWRANPTDRIRHLLGVAQGRLIVSGDALWGLDLRTGDIAWSVRPTEPEQAGYGRGWLAGETVIFPSREALSVVVPRTGQVLREQPLLTPEARRFGGNVVASSGVVLVASPDRLTAYGEYARPVKEDKKPGISFVKPFGDRRPVLRAMAASAVRALEPAEAPRTADTAVAHGTVASHVSGSQPSLTGFWTRAWQRDLSVNRERLLIPEGTSSSPDDALVFVQTASLTACDRRTGTERWSIPLDRPVRWAAYHHGRMLWATDDELVAAHPQSGAAAYRLPWRAELTRGLPITDSEARWRIERRGDIALFIDPRHGLLACDVVRGTVLWRQTAPVWFDAATLSAGPDVFVTHPPQPGFMELTTIATGRRLLRNSIESEPWRRPPVWSRDSRQFVTVPPSGPLTAHAADGTARLRLGGSHSQSHTAPWPFERHGHWFAIIDGLTLVRFADNGSRLWSATLTDVPILDPVRQLGLTSDRVVAAAGGECRCVDLDDGHTLWSRPLTNRGPHRVSIIGPASDQTLLLPEQPDHAVSDVDCLALSSGQTRQRIRLPHPARNLTAISDDQGMLLVTGFDLLALMPHHELRP